MALYKLLSDNSGILRTSDEAIIPNDPLNVDWQAYLAWANVPGNVADPVVAASQQDPIRLELSQLDLFIPRGLEDYWTATAFVTTNLPAIQQRRLAQKQQLRTQLAALIAAGTP